MTTSEPAPNGGETGPLTLFAADSPASPSASPGKASRRRIAGGSGQHSQASFATYDPASSSWRTFRVSLDGEWETYSETWPSSGMTRNGTAYRRPSSVPPIYATASGSWPTPSATLGTHAGLVTPAKAREGGTLVEALPARMWPTPRAIYGEHPGMVDPRHLTGAVQVMPTPTANRWDGLRSHGVNVVTGQLNPRWVEWLMGYPGGWTDCAD